MAKLPKVECESCPSREGSVFCNMQMEELQELSGHKVTNRYKKGQTLFFQGNPPFGIYCISKGKVKVSKIGNEGKESIVRIAAEGDVLGHRSLFTDEFYNATATAIEDAEICFLDKKYILEVLKENPSVSMKVIEKLSSDMGAAENKVASLFQKNVRERVAELLLSLKATYGVEEEKGWRLDIKLTREEMSSMIGMANETLIRLLSEFKDDGLIEQQGKTIYLTNEEALLEYANVSY